jgi:ABC-type sugar transport system permease subunit
MLKVFRLLRSGGKPLIPARVSSLIVPYLFLLPALTGVILFRIYPILYSFIGSLYKIQFAQGTHIVFGGLANYQDIFTDPVFFQSLKVTVIFNIFVNPIQIALALSIAVLVHETTMLNRIFRTIYFIPLGVSVAIASTLWGMLLNPTSGLVNSFLQFLGFAAQPFLSSHKQALPSIILICVWGGVSYWMLFFLAGLQEIPVELYEAATIDGAGAWASFWTITLPLLRRVILFVLVADTSANFLLFIPIFVLTRGGPQMTTNTLMYEIYNTAFTYHDIPRALTMSAVLLLLLLIVVRLQFKLIGKEQ